MPHQPPHSGYALYYQNKQVTRTYPWRWMVYFAASWNHPQAFPPASSVWGVDDLDTKEFTPGYIIKQVST